MKYRLPYLLPIFWAAIIFTQPGVAFSQQEQDSVAIQQAQQQSIKKANKEPNKAALMSAILPGLGQAYNKKYWKMPIIYAGMGTLTYFIIRNGRDYVVFKEAYKRRIAGEPDVTPKYNIGVDIGLITTSQMKVFRDDARRYRDMSILFTGALYALNIIDAYVDAHLKEFDINNDLAFSVKPLFYNQFNAQLAAGITLNLKIK